MRCALPTFALVSACSAPAVVQTCDATIADHMATLPVVSLSTSTSTEAWVTYAAAGEDHQQSAATSGTDHDHWLRGMPAETEVAWTAWIDDGDGPREACSDTLTTGVLPDDLPEILISEATDEALSDGTLYLGAAWRLFGEYAYLLVFDRAGVVRWYVGGPYEAMILESQVARDGSDILYDYMDGNFKKDIASLERVSLDGVAVSSVVTPMGHHMFVQLPDGNLAYQALDVRPWKDSITGETRDVVGDAIIELLPDGTTETITSTWDWSELPSPDDNIIYGIYGRAQDWTHGNALKYDEDADEYLLSLGNIGVVAQIDRATGEPTQLYGALGLTVGSNGEPFAHQHDPTLTGDDSLTVFLTDASVPASGAVEYRIDRDAGQLVEQWRYGFQVGDYSPLLGQVTELSRNRTRVNYGGGGKIEEIDGSGGLVWRAELPNGFAFAQVSEFVGFWPSD